MHSTALLSSLDRQDEPFPKFVTDAQSLLDAHTVRFLFSMGSHFITEGDKEIANRALQSGRFGRIEKLNRITKGICQEPMPHWPNSSGLLGNPIQIQFFVLEPIRKQAAFEREKSHRKGNSASRQHKAGKTRLRADAHARLGVLQRVRFLY